MCKKIKKMKSSSSSKKQCQLLETEIDQDIYNPQVVVQKNSKVTLHYDMFYPNGVGVATSGKQYDLPPIKVRAGIGHFLPGVDSLIVGMKKGETSTLILLPTTAYNSTPAWTQAACVPEVDFPLVVRVHILDAAFY
mmetsp:Transcript_17133/g.26760  ORF Transcript_17133/g.26760 Transcript_17133/m.26760 type:complete len:136 (+) Transcript_17133:2-409(+)